MGPSTWVEEAQCVLPRLIPALGQKAVPYCSNFNGVGDGDGRHADPRPALFAGSLPRQHLIFPKMKSELGDQTIAAGTFRKRL